MDIVWLCALLVWTILFMDIQWQVTCVHVTAHIHSHNIQVFPLSMIATANILLTPLCEKWQRQNKIGTSYQTVMSMCSMTNLMSWKDINGCHCSLMNTIPVLFLNQSFFAESSIPSLFMVSSPNSIIHYINSVFNNNTIQIVIIFTLK